VAPQQALLGGLCKLQVILTTI
jgi:SpoVK/Ycf46/Vps4 family AAA+-type ATPase